MSQLNAANRIIVKVVHKMGSASEDEIFPVAVQDGFRSDRRTFRAKLGYLCDRAFLSESEGKYSIAEAGSRELAEV